MKPALMTFESDVEISLLDLDSAVAKAHGFVSDVTKTYLDILLLHSYPVVNTNGMTLTGTMLANRFPTAQHQPLNLDHQMEGNPPEVFEGENQIVGSIVESYLPSTDSEPQLLPTVAVPGKLVAVVWNRTEAGQTIIANIHDDKQKKKYKASFEIVRANDEDGWVVDGKYHDEISDELKQEWADGNYSRVALAVGGKVGQTAHFFGGAFTMVPADPKSKVEAILASFSKKDHLAIAVATKQKIGSTPMDFIKKLIQAVIAQAGFGVTVSGNSLSISMGDTKLDNPADFYAFGYADSDGNYHVGASVTVAEGGKAGGFEQQRRLTYNPEAEGDAITEETVSASDDHKKIDASTMFALMAEKYDSIISQTTESVRAEFDGYFSPEAHKTAVKEAVAAALKDANVEPTESTSDQPAEDKPMDKTKTQDMIDSSLAAASDARSAVASRSAALAENALALTPSRKTAIEAFAVGEAGDKEFAGYLSSLVASQTKMFEALDKAKVKVTDDIKGLVAQIDNFEDLAFQALLAGSPAKVANAAVATVQPTFGGGHPLNPRNDDGGSAKVMAL